MDMKAMMFAGGGLFISMVATTMWISGDVSRMREEEQARRDAACATAQVAAAEPGVGSPDAAAADPMATGGASVDAHACPADGAAASDDGGRAVIDPATGQAVQPDVQYEGATGAVDPGAATSDPYAAGNDPYASSGDPSMGDPYSGEPYAMDPYAAPVDPAAGAGF